MTNIDDIELIKQLMNSQNWQLVVAKFEPKLPDLKTSKALEFDDTVEQIELQFANILTQSQLTLRAPVLMDCKASELIANIENYISRHFLRNQE